MALANRSEILSDHLLLAVAHRAASYDYRIWGFGEGPALLGMLRAGELLSQQSLIDTVAALVEPALHADIDPTDHLIPVEVLEELQRLRPDLAAEHLIERFSTAVMAATRPRPHQPPVHRPDLSHLSSMIWVDCLHTDLPGLTLAGFHDAAIALAEEVCGVMQDESGLFSHGYDITTELANQVHWGRGQGWALHGLVLGASSPALQSRLEALLRALETWEKDGSWHTIVDDRDSPIEHSVSALVASGILSGISQERLSKSWLPLAERALSSAVQALDDDGGLPVSEATPVGDRENYLTRRNGVFPWGQGPLLLALIEGRNHW